MASLGGFEFKVSSKSKDDNQSGVLHTYGQVIAKVVANPTDGQGYCQFRNQDAVNAMNELYNSLNGIYSRIYGVSNHPFYNINLSDSDRGMLCIRELQILSRLQDESALLASKMKFGTYYTVLLLMNLDTKQHVIRGINLPSGLTFAKAEEQSYNFAGTLKSQEGLYLRGMAYFDGEFRWDLTYQQYLDFLSVKDAYM